MALELGRVNDRKPPFKFSSLDRVGFSDTDAQGIVYYGRYLPYFDAARVEYHRHLDMLKLDLGGELVMRAANIEYHAPARFDDLLEVFIRVASSSTSRSARHVRCRTGSVSGFALSKAPTPSSRPYSASTTSAATRLRKRASAGASPPL
jgi:YbgC/YbaW family acyl-CoA thioester hydrolase